MAALPARQAAEAESGYAAACCRDSPGRDFFMALADFTGTRRPWLGCTQRPAAATPASCLSAAAHRVWPGRCCTLRTQPRSRAFRRLSHASAHLRPLSPRLRRALARRSAGQRLPLAGLSFEALPSDCGVATPRGACARARGRAVASDSPYVPCACVYINAKSSWRERGIFPPLASMRLSQSLKENQNSC